jgi:hypothetical protein
MAAMKKPALANAKTIFVGFVLVGGLTILSATATAQPREPSLGSIPAIKDWRAISLPLDAYSQDFAGRQTVLKAEYAVTKDCMAEFGFDFVAPVWDKNAAELGGQPGHYRLFGLLDGEHATQMGYHSYGENPASETSYADKDLSNDYFNLLAAKFGGGVFNGRAIPDGGCLGAAQRTVEGTTDFSWIDLLGYDAWTASNSDSRVVAGFANWSRCMAGSGYQYRTPMEANNDPKWSGEKASAEEIAVAVADVGCKKATNLAGIRMAVEAAYQLDAIGVHRAELDALRAAYARQTATALAILAKQ